jgi:WD40 repeat protein
VHLASGAVEHRLERLVAAVVASLGAMVPRLSGHGRVLATSSPHDRIARLWDAGAGRLLKELDGRSQLQAVAFAPGDRELVTAGFDGTVRLWDVATGDSRWTLSGRDGPVSALAFSADGGTLACGVIGAIRLYRLGTPTQAASR